jgi:intracellular sulfur oxidation DsrE/DsrF family protein
MTQKPSDEMLNALIDGQLDSEERAKILAKLAADPALNKRVNSFRKIKSLVRHAYADLPVETAPRSRSGLHRGIYAFCGVAILSIGIGLGHVVSVRSHFPGGIASIQTGARGLVIQIVDKDAGKWLVALEQAQAAQSSAKDGLFQVAIVGYGAGVEMLRADSPVIDALQKAHSSGIRLVACGIAMRQNGISRSALASVVEPAEAGGIVEIVRLQRQGYGYVRL